MMVTVRMLLLGGLTGKALGIARELLAAALFGTGPVAVAYRLAQAGFLIPLNGLLSDAFTAGFTPAYSRSRLDPMRGGAALFAGMHVVVLSVAVTVALLLACFAGQWVRLLAPRFSPHTAELATQMVQVLSLAMPFYALTGLYASAELARGQARMAAARASTQSLGLIGGTLAAWWTGNALYIAVGFLLAYALLAALGLTSSLQQGLRPWPRAGEWPAARHGLQEVWRAFRVLMCVPVLLQLHFIVERRVASIVSPEALAALDYARFVSDTAVLMLAVPIGLAGLGAMANLSPSRFRELAHRSLRMLLYIGAPLSVVLTLHAEPIVRVVFARGAFGADSIAVTTAILQTLAVGLWAQLLGYAGAKFLNARGRNGGVIGIYVAATACNVFLNLTLHPYIGAAALGVSAAAGSLVFGLLMLNALELLKPLRDDLMTLAAMALAYGCLWAVIPADTGAPWWLPPFVFAAYWCLAGITVPRCREVLHDAWLSLRTA